MSREAPIGEETEEAFEHREFFDRADEWKGHWRNDFAPSDWHATPEELIEQHDFWRVFSDCLSPLPKRTASAFTLREIDGLTGEEICEMLSITVNNLWMMLHRAGCTCGIVSKSWFKRE